MYDAMEKKGKENFRTCKRKGIKKTRFSPLEKTGGTKKSDYDP